MKNVKISDPHRTCNFQVYESNAYEEIEGSEGMHHHQRVLGHIPVGDGMVGTITLLDPEQHQQQQQEEGSSSSPHKKRKYKPIPYQNQFAHLTQVKTIVCIDSEAVLPRPHHIFS